MTPAVTRPVAAVSRPAFTVVCAPRDNLMLQVAISYAAPGDVIVVGGQLIRPGAHVLIDALRDRPRRFRRASPRCGRARGCPRPPP